MLEFINHTPKTMSQAKATYSRYRQRLRLTPPTWDNLSPEEQDAWDYAIAPLMQPTAAIGQPLPPKPAEPFFPINPFKL